MRKQAEMARVEPPATTMDATILGTPALFDSYPDGVLLVDSDGLIRKVNKTLCEMTGYSKDELEGHPIESLTPTALRERHVYLRENYMNARTPRPMGLGLEIKMRTKLGADMPVDIALMPLELDTLRGVIAVIRDAAGRDRLQEQLARTKEHLTHMRGEVSQLHHDLRTLFTAPDRPGATLSPDGRIRHANPLLCSLLECKPAMLEGRNLFDMVHLDDPEAVLHELHSEKHLVGPLAASISAGPRSRKRRWMEVSLLPLVSAESGRVSEILIRASSADDYRFGSPGEPWLVELVAAGSAARTPIEFLRAACRIANGLMPETRCEFLAQHEDGTPFTVGSGANRAKQAIGAEINAELTLGFARVTDRDALYTWAVGRTGFSPIVFETLSPHNSSTPQIAFAVWGNSGDEATHEVSDQLPIFTRSIASLYGSVRRAWLQQVATATVATLEHAVIVADQKGRLVYANRRAADALLEPGEPEHAATSWLSRVKCTPGLFSQAFLDQLADGEVFRQSGRIEQPGHISVPVEITGKSLYLAHSAPNAVLVIFENISRLKEIEGFAHHVTLYDGITGLPNLNLAASRLNQALLKNDPETVGMLAIQVNRFKQLRAALGHGIADEIVQELAARLVSSAKPGEMAARLDTDDFALVLLDVESTKQLDGRIARIDELLRRPILTSAGEVFVSSRIGSARGWTGGSAEALISRAGAGARIAHGGFHDLMDGKPLDYDSISASIDKEMALHRAVMNREFIAHYQPQIALGNRTIIGAEALVRWQRRPNELIMPADFLGMAEEVGIVNDIGRIMLETACEVLSEWAKQGVDTQLSVNVSGHQLLQAGFPDLVKELLDRFSFPSDRLTLEITETALMADLEVATARMRNLRDLGVALAIDDFGTGYSSLTYLRKLPFTEMKLDRSFIAGLGSDAGDEAIVSSVVRLGQTFGIRTVAEGVETEMQYERLLAMGCDSAQGYLFGKPMPLDSLRAKIVTPH